ncbi:hypothetical protein [Aquimarina longa]|uniref:hypothetical protein n=1 Tax=Aquimarina longa TaxID=1080221 RepID=UPI000784AF72|nr:hypothetical protein [Aquimarina longa]
MIGFLASYSPFRKKLIALEYSNNKDTPIIIGLELAQKKGELENTQTFTVASADELSELIKNQKASLVITDDNVLSKEVSHTGTDIEIVGEAFPNLNLNDFYYQILRTSEKSFIAVCRKEHVENSIEQFKKEAIKIVAISLGGLKLEALSGYADNENLKSYTTTVSFNNGEVVSLLPKKEDIEEEYTIEGLSFLSIHTLPLAVVLNTVLNSDTISGNLEIKNQELYQEYTESQFFKNTLQIGVGFLLITLLINFFVFNANYKKWQGLQEELQVYTTQKEQILKKQAEVSIKDTLVQSILATGFSKSSYYINTITQVQPSTIILASIAYQPLEKPIRKDKAIELTQHHISITGTSTDKTDFTIWLRTIEGLPFVNTVTIIQYGLDKKNASNFELTLSIKTDETED